MPRRYKKKRWKRKSRRRSRAPILAVGKSLVPANRLYSVRYCDTVSLNPGVGGVTQTHLFRANHIHDPDASFGGHQPLGHDELAQFFNHYVVVGSKMTVKFQTITSDNYECGVYLAEDATPIVDVNRIREYQKGTVNYISGGSKQQANALSTYSAKKFFGVGSVTSADKLWGTFGAVPDVDNFDQAYYHLWVHGAGDADEAPIYCHITIDYTIKMKEPKVLGSS